jgi:hypothetical protein
MSGASVVIHKQNKYIRTFNELGAVDEAHSIELEEAGIRRSYVFSRMVDRGVFIKCWNGKFYIDNDAAERFKGMRRKRAVVALIVMLVLFAAYYLLGGR